MSRLLTYFADTIISADKVGLPKVSGSVLQNVMNTVYFWGGVIAVIVIIAAGFLYVTSANNAQQITRAKNAILGAVIGLVVILLAFVITSIVINGVSK